MITWGQGITSIVGGHLTYEGYYLLSATGMDRNHVKNKNSISGGPGVPLERLQSSNAPIRDPVLCRHSPTHIY